VKQTTLVTPKSTDNVDSVEPNVVRIALKSIGHLNVRPFSRKRLPIE
jgi:hypothetical protein